MYLSYASAFTFRYLRDGRRLRSTAHPTVQYQLAAVADNPSVLGFFTQLGHVG